VFHRVLQRESAKVGLAANPDGTNVPQAQQLTSYKSAFWSTFALGVFGESFLALLLTLIDVVAFQLRYWQ
jgi:hypothetical protein